MVVLRRLMFLLFAVNLLVLLWLVLRPATSDEGGQNSGILLPPLVHIDELSQDLISGLSSSANEPALAPANVVQNMPSIDGCWVRGPFASDAAATEAMRSSGFVDQVQLLRSEIAGPLLYRAMLAPSANREQAELQLSEVLGAIERVGGGIDTYIVTSGPIANAVSLGLFGEHANALNVQSLLAAQGVDVLVVPENRLETAFWIVMNGSDVVDIEGETLVAQGFERAPAALSENLCEMIAQAE